MKLKNNLKLLVIKNGYNSIRDFSERNNLSYVSVLKLSKSESKTIEIKMLMNLCELLNCTIDDLLEIEGQAS